MTTATPTAPEDNDQATEPEAAPAVEPEPNHDAETLEKIIALNSDVTEARIVYDRADRARKSAKEELEECQAALNEFIVGLGERYPLFDGKEPAAAPDDAWREASVEALDLPRIIITKLEDVGIMTVGDISDWTAKRPLTDVSGIGEAKVGQIEAALTKFWRARGDAEVLAGVKEAEAAAKPKRGGRTTGATA